MQWPSDWLAYRKALSAVAVGPLSGDTAIVRTPLRLACFVVTALGVCIPGMAAACSLEPPPPPSPRTPTETEAEFSARSRTWYEDIYERERKAALPGMTAHEDRLWASAARVVLARVEKVGSIR